jgi:multiple sugar transport system substrate-binding protein
MFRKNVILVCVSLLTVLIVFSGCKGKSSPASADSSGTNWITAADISNMPETTIRYWFYETPERITLGQKQIEEFQKKFPNIKVSGSTAPDNTDNEMLMPYIQSRTNSNIQQSVNIEDLWYVEHGLVYPINNFPDFKEVMARFDPDLNYTWIDGNAYSISWYMGPNVMYYNKKYLEQIGWNPAKPPETYSEYYDFAKKITNPAQNRYAMNPWVQEEWWRWQFQVYPFYIAASGSSQLVNKDGKTVMFNNPNGVKTLEFFETLFDNGWASKEVFTDDTPFVTGIAASARGQSDLIKTINASAPPGFEYIIAPIPIPDGNTRGKFDTYAFVRNFAIIDELGVPEGEARDRVRRASWEFMKFLLSDEQTALDFAVSGDLPCLANFQTNPLIKPVFDSFGQAMADLVRVGANSTIPDMNTPLECEIAEPLQQAYLQVVYDRASAAEAMAWAEKEANKLLADYVAP